jgi:hypothetical protein
MRTDIPPDAIATLRRVFRHLEEVAPASPDLPSSEIRRPGHRRRWSPILVVAAAFLAAVVLTAPAALLFRSGSGATSDAGPTLPGGPATTAASTTHPGLTGDTVELSAPAYREEGGSGLSAVFQTADGFVVSNGRSTIWSRDAKTWVVGGATLEGDDWITSFAARGDTAVAVGARDGRPGRLYRSEERGSGWETFELPADDGTLAVAVHVVVTDDAGFVALGVGTKSTFDDNVTLYLWTSADGIEWTVERVAEMGGEFTYAETVANVDGATVVLAQTFADRILAFERTGGGDAWSRTDLSSILAVQAGITPDLINAAFSGEATMDGKLTTWWTFDDGKVGAPKAAAAVLRRTGPGSWEALPVAGEAPTTITRTGHMILGTAHVDATPGIQPGSTSLVASTDGVDWQEFARFDGVALETLVEIGPGLFLTSGAETEANPDGFPRVAAGAVWNVILPDDLNTIIQADR